jgi:hypothetical protein
MTEKAGAVSHRQVRPVRERMSVIRQIQLVSPVLVYYPPVDLKYTRGRWTGQTRVNHDTAGRC